MRKTRFAEVIVETEELLVITKRPVPTRHRCDECGEQIEIETEQEENYVAEKTKPA